MTTHKGTGLVTAFLLFTLLSCGKKENSVESYIGFDIPKSTVDQYLEEQMKARNIPGMSIALFEDGKIVHHKTFGYANWQDSVKVNDQTIFEAASLSKPMFAYFVMKYVDEGKLDLDKPLYEYLPYPDIAHDERYKQITARMVLSHRSGFPNWRNDLPDKRLVIQFDPGTDFFYSGEGYMYLSKVLKHIDQTDWEGLERSFQAKVAQPLGLEHTVFIQDDYSIRHKAEPYDENGQWVSPERDYDSLFRYQFRAPASVHTEAIDFSKWLIALSNREGLSAASYQEMWKVHSFVDEYNGIPIDYTLGFYKPDLPLTNIYSHGGNNYGFTAYFTFDPDKKWGFALFTNSEYGEELGGEFSFFMLTGPDLTKLYIIAGAILLTVLVLLFLGLRFLIRRLKKRRG